MEIASSSGDLNKQDITSLTKLKNDSIIEVLYISTRMLSAPPSCSGEYSSLYTICMITSEFSRSHLPRIHFYKRSHREI